MAIRLYRAYSPGTRSKSVSYFDDLTQIKPERTLTFGKVRSAEEITVVLLLLKVVVVDTSVSTE